MLPIWLVIVIAVICFGIAAVIFWFVSKSSTQKSYESKIDSAEEPRLPAHDQCMLSHDISACSAT